MSYTDTELEAMASAFDHGITDAHLEGAVGSPGPLGWFLDVVDDWDAFTARAENLTPKTSSERRERSFNSRRATSCTFRLTK